MYSIPVRIESLCEIVILFQCKQEPINQIITLAGLLETCDFQKVWTTIYNLPHLYKGINGFQDSIRKFVCHVVGITFQTINKYTLCELLGNIDGEYAADDFLSNISTSSFVTILMFISDNTLKMWVKKYGWKEIENNMIFISNQDDNIKTKNISEDIVFDKLVEILNVH